MSDQLSATVEYGRNEDSETGPERYDAVAEVMWLADVVKDGYIDSDVMEIQKAITALEGVSLQAVRDLDIATTIALLQDECSTRTAKSLAEVQRIFDELDEPVYFRVVGKYKADDWPTYKLEGFTVTDRSRILPVTESGPVEQRVADVYFKGSKIN